MMNLTKQAYLFIYCVQIGILIGVLYEIIRSIRKTIKHANWVVQIEDFIYCFSCGVLAFIMIYKKNYGEIRLYVFLGMLIGLVLYYCIASKYIQYIIVKVLQTLYYLLNFIFKPIKCIINILTKLIKKIKVSEG